ncbi:MAG: glycosyltransferase, partial [Flavobacteriales bacterium]|nr:glycosyltransferase [Flavobacteriales bacterium]
LIHAGNGFKSNISLCRYLFYKNYSRKLNTAIKLMQEPDIIVCAFPLIDVAYRVVKYANIKNIPIILDIRDLWPDTIINAMPTYLRGLVRIILNKDFLMTKYVLKKSTALCAMSIGVLNWGLHNAKRQKSKNDLVVPIGYSKSSYNENVFNADDLNPKIKNIHLKSKKIFTYVGTFGFTYDLDLILEVAAKIEKSEPDIVFILAGAGPKLKYLKSVYDKLNNVIFTGWLKNNDVKFILNNSNAGLLPWDSIDNAMPNKFFDYISNGLPVISSANGELNILINKKKIGLTYKRQNLSELRNNILKLSYDISLNNEYKLNAINLYKEKYSENFLYSTYAKNVEAICNQDKI